MKLHLNRYTKPLPRLRRKHPWTHNPYLLSSIVEKTPMKDLNVFVTTMEQFETRLKRVPDENLPELLELDSAAFFNLDRLAAE